jgi:hypothetical protein
MSISNSLTEDDHAARRGDFVFAAALPGAGGNVSLLRSRTRCQHRDLFSAPGVEALAPRLSGAFSCDVIGPVHAWQASIFSEARRWHRE